MPDPHALLLKANLKTLGLPTMPAEHDTRAREAAAADEPSDADLVRRTELEVAARAANAVAARTRAAGFPVGKDLDAFAVTAVPALPRQKAPELARGEWVGQHANGCRIGGAGPARRTWRRPSGGPCGGSAGGSGS